MNLEHFLNWPIVDYILYTISSATMVQDRMLHLMAKVPPEYQDYVVCIISQSEISLLENISTLKYTYCRCKHDFIVAPDKSALKHMLILSCIVFQVQCVPGRMLWFNAVFIRHLHKSYIFCEGLYSTRPGFASSEELHYLLNCST